MSKLVKRQQVLGVTIRMVLKPRHAPSLQLSHGLCVISSQIMLTWATRPGAIQSFPELIPQRSNLHVRPCGGHAYLSQKGRLRHRPRFPPFLLSFSPFLTSDFPLRTHIPMPMHSIQFSCSRHDQPQTPRLSGSNYLCPLGPRLLYPGQLLPWGDLVVRHLASHAAQV